MIQPLNYSAHALEDILSMAFRLTTAPGPHDPQQKMLAKHLEDHLAAMVIAIRKAEKFILPEDADLLHLDSFKPHYLDLLKLPFPVIALEVPCSGRLIENQTLDDDVIRKRLILALELPEGQITLMEVRSHRDETVWAISDWVAVIDLKRVRFEGDRCTGIQLVPLYGRDIPSLHEDAHFSFKALVQFCLTVNCENVRQEIIEAPLALNKKRAANGKVPLFSSRVLILPSEKHSPSTAMGGTHASPRMHLRRGHLRRLQSTKVIWVRHTMVGNPDHGVVEKTYALTQPVS